MAEIDTDRIIFTHSLSCRILHIASVVRRFMAVCRFSKGTVQATLHTLVVKSRYSLIVFSHLLQPKQGFDFTSMSLLIAAFGQGFRALHSRYYRVK